MPLLLQVVLLTFATICSLGFVAEREVAQKPYYLLAVAVSVAFIIVVEVVVVP